jgi:hypothetical protein
MNNVDCMRLMGFLDLTTEDHGMPGFISPDRTMLWSIDLEAQVYRLQWRDPNAADEMPALLGRPPLYEGPDLEQVMAQYHRRRPWKTQDGYATFQHLLSDVANPLMSVCGRREVDPCTTYGFVSVTTREGRRQWQRYIGRNALMVVTHMVDRLDVRIWRTGEPAPFLVYDMHPHALRPARGIEVPDDERVLGRFVALHVHQSGESVREFSSPLCLDKLKEEIFKVAEALGIHYQPRLGEALVIHPLPHALPELLELH